VVSTIWSGLGGELPVVNASFCVKWASASKGGGS